MKSSEAYPIITLDLLRRLADKVPTTHSHDLIQMPERLKNDDVINIKKLTRSCLIMAANRTLGFTKCDKIPDRPKSLIFQLPQVMRHMSSTKLWIIDGMVIFRREP